MTFGSCRLDFVSVVALVALDPSFVHVFYQILNDIFVSVMFYLLQLLNPGSVFF